MITQNVPEDPEYLNITQHFQSYDLGLASTLVTLGYELWSLDKANPRKVQFTFKKSDGIEKASKAYWDNLIQVNARTLIENQKMLKNRIYSE